MHTPCLAPAHPSLSTCPRVSRGHDAPSGCDPHRAGTEAASRPPRQRRRPDGRTSRPFACGPRAGRSRAVLALCRSPRAARLRLDDPKGASPDQVGGDHEQRPVRRILVGRWVEPQRRHPPGVARKVDHDAVEDADQERRQRRPSRDRGKDRARRRAEGEMRDQGRSVSRPTVHFRGRARARRHPDHQEARREGESLGRRQAPEHPLHRHGHGRRRSQSGNRAPHEPAHARATWPSTRLPRSSCRPGLA